MTRQQSTEVHLLRYVPGESPVHRLWAGTKLVCVFVLGTAAVIHPTWIPQAVVGALLLAAWRLSRVPLTALPAAPRWVLIGLGIGAALSILGGGDPSIHIGPLRIGIGGFIEWLRFTSLISLLFGLATLVGWTTAMADVAPALSRLLSPVRRMLGPARGVVDDLVVAIALSIRCLPLLVEEVRVLQAARRMRQPHAPGGVRQRVVYLHDLLVTALVSSLRRARELADAMEARGGPATPVATKVRLRRGDVIALATAVAAATFMLLA